MASGSKKIIYAAVIGNSGIAVTKFIAASMTGSGAMLAEAIHSVVDSMNQVLLLWGIKQSNRPATKEFPLGYGKEVYFWSFVVAILVFAVGAGVSLYEGVKRLIHPHAIENVTVNYVVLLIAMVFEGVAWWMALKAFKEVKGDRGYLQAARAEKDPTMYVVLLEDSAALLGLMVAFVGIWLGQMTGIAYFDGAATVVIGLILTLVACFLAWETKSLLIGEAADPRVDEQIRKIVSDDDRIAAVNELITVQMGPHHILVNLSLDFADSLNIGVLEEAIAEFNQRIKAAIPAVRRVFIEAESYSAHQRQQQLERDSHAVEKHDD
jgi:cation diffusion facilitator family transporter